LEAVKRSQEKEYLHKMLIDNQRAKRKELADIEREKLEDIKAY
jgi:hypothetical protein